MRRNKTVCLNMIVKNESRAIEKCLESVKSLIDYWVIVDTGSTDGTQEKIRRCMKGVDGELHQRAWKDFAHNRNEALDLAKNKADYYLFIDADQRLVYDETFSLPFLEKDRYFIQIREASGVSAARECLVAAHLDWAWEGVIHELITCPQAKTLAQLDGISIFTDTNDGFRSADPKKYMKDAKVLEEALEKDPYNTRNVFYLATSYRNAGEHALALKYFQRRAVLGGFPEEVFMSLYVSGLLQETMGEPAEVYMKSYHKAFEFRPTRAEPLYSMAEYYFRDTNFNFAYVLLKTAQSMSKPNECQFIYDDIYDHGILMRLADCSYELGKTQETVDILRALLKKQLSEELHSQIKNNIQTLLKAGKGALV